MIHPSKNILLTGGRAPATLHLARLLKQQGHIVCIADTFAKNLTSVSKYIDKSFITSAPRQSPKDFVAEMVNIITDNEIDVLIPTCEETFHISLHKSNFEKHCMVFTSDILLMQELHDKWKFNQLLKKLSLPFPKSFFTKTQGELSSAIKEVNQFVAKPVYSRFADKVIINDKNELGNVNINEKEPWVIQEYIEGSHFCSFSIANKGHLSAHAVYPVGYRVQNGAAIYFEAIEVPEIEDIVTTIAKDKKYTGFLSFDFIKKETDGKFYTIECNPRVTSGIHLFDSKDAFMPFKKSLSICYPKENNRMMLTVAMVLYNLAETRSWTSFWDLIQCMLKAEDVVFSWRDLKPFFAQFMSIFYFYKLAKENNISILEATTHHIEWNGDML
ncbi:MAG: ATP-grasp domain-containing protein [Saprospiraceae bacterium]|nr:ATP-grasp domain-containing protein [Saprospiraceae bacterium]